MQVGVGLSKYSIESSTSLPVKTFKPLVYRLLKTVDSVRLILKCWFQWANLGHCSSCDEQELIMIVEPRS